ncbi:MAG: VIT domain-containing protein [Planctomycetota bacterium]|jgi:Ca-activated chloride channel family protein
MKGKQMETQHNTRSHEIVGYLIAGILIFFLVFSGVSKGAGLLKPTNGDASDVFIKSHHVNVTINNGFAKTEVDQVFGNNSDTDLEAVYTFPIPKQASLSEVSLWIDGQEVIGEVVEKKKARQIYEDQVSRGNDTAIAEKNDYMTFDIAVYPVRAGGETRVRLVYYQPLEIDSNIGRYLYPLAEGGVDDERIAFWSVDDVVHEAFSFDLTLKSAFPVEDVRLPGYMDKALIEQAGQAAEEQTGQSDEYHIHLESTEGGALTRDIVVYYRLADDIPARVEVVPYRAGDNTDGTFMVVITPAADLQHITEGVDWVFVLDKSGSMSGGKIATLADGVSKAIGQMNPNDRFRVITFNNGARDFSGGYQNATPGNIQSILGKLSSLKADGGTNLFAGVKKAYKGLDDDRTTNILLVTDGVANVGPTQHSDFLNLLQQYDIRLFTFVIGNSANQPLMERLAKDSNGFAMNISDSDDIVGRIMQIKSKVLYEGLHDVELIFHGEKVKDLTPANPGSLYQGQQLVMFGRYNGSGPVRVELRAKISGQQHSWDCEADFPEVDTDNLEIERLWALSMIDETMQQIREKGEKKSLKKTIMDLGTEYSLVTDYTSMVVLSEEQMEEAGIQRRNADRVNRERQAQQQRQQQGVKNYRVDQNKQNPSGNNGAFDGRRSPGIGGGPVGPLFVGLALWLSRRKKK